MNVELVYCPAPGRADIEALVLPEGATVGEALAAAGLLARHGLQAEGLAIGIWGRRCELSARLRERDRVEIYRPLVVDPKEARRQRYRGQRRRQEPGPPLSGNPTR